jgi:hypothetical protein
MLPGVRSPAPSDGHRDDFPDVRTRRLDEQRWLLDATIRQLGMDWDQGRTRYLAAACGVDAEADFARVRFAGRPVVDRLRYVDVSSWVTEQPRPGRR